MIAHYSKIISNNILLEILNYGIKMYQNESNKENMEKKIINYADNIIIETIADGIYWDDDEFYFRTMNYMLLKYVEKYNNKAKIMFEKILSGIESYNNSGNKNTTNELLTNVLIALQGFSHKDMIALIRK